MASVDPQAVARCQVRLKTQFRQDFDADLVTALMEMHAGDVNAVISFLTAAPGDPEPFQQTNDGLPEDYFKKPKNVPANRRQTGKNAARGDAKFKALFLQDSSFNEHVVGQLESYGLYVSTLLLLVKQKVDIGSPVRGRVLAAALARRDYELVQHLLSLGVEHYGIPEVLKAVHLLDAPRRIRQTNKRIQTLQRRGGSKPATIGQLMARINELRVDSVAVNHPTVRVSLTGPMSKRLRAWVRTISAADLRFYALSLPTEPWRELADMLHLRSDDFQVEWFLPFVFGSPPPPDSVLAQVADMDWDNLVTYIRDYSLPYSFIRRSIPDGMQPSDISDEAKEEIAKNEPLKTVIWWYEDLACSLVNNVITLRLKGGETPDLSYGKLMERLMVFESMDTPFFPLLIPIAEEKMTEIALPLEPPVVVIGDASYSMDVAIRTATIISGVLCYLADADLGFFNGEYFTADKVPRTIPEVLDTARTVRADGLTAPAAALRYFYDRKEKVNVMVLVTDEIENVPYEGEFFAQLFCKYYDEVCPAKLVFVSFLERNEEKGRMVRALESFGFEPLQFRLDQTRPDLTKLDALVGILAAETSFFEEETSALASALNTEGLAQVQALLKSNKRVSPGPARAGPAVPAGATTAQYEDSSLCRVCLDLENEYAIVPCGHQVLCENCKDENLGVCPVCRTPIQSIIKIFKD